MDEQLKRMMIDLAGRTSAFKATCEQASTQGRALSDPRRASAEGIATFRRQLETLRDEAHDLKELTRSTRRKADEHENIDPGIARMVGDLCDEYLRELTKRTELLAAWIKLLNKLPGIRAIR